LSLRAITSTIEAHGGDVVTPSEHRETDLQRAQDELARLLKRAEQGDHSVLPELRKALAADANLWRHYGDLAAQAEASLILLAAGNNLLLAESLQHKLQALKDELGGESPSPLERLLVERTTATWLQVSSFDGLAAQSAAATEARLKLILKEQDAAHRRHLTAVKTLATVRKLLRPTPSTLELLHYPVSEGAGDAKNRLSRGGVALAAVPRG
jgi:hypothetical protein